MNDDDFDNFSALLDGVAALTPPGTPLGATGRAMFFRAMAGLSIDQVRACLDAHVRDPARGRFFPRPADLFAQVIDGRPGADEAWSTAIRGKDERASVVMSEEIAEAWGIARPIALAGDDIGARIAFREAYNRLVTEARRAGVPIAWFASLGHDREGQAEALAEEARLMRREPATAIAAPGPRPLLAGAAGGIAPKVAAELARVAEIARARKDDSWLADLEARKAAGEILTEEQQRMISGGREALALGDDAQARERTRQLQEASAARVADYAQAHGIRL